MDEFVDKPVDLDEMQPDAAALQSVEEVTPEELAAAGNDIDPVLTDDLVGAYLREAGRHPLLSSQQEEALARRIAQGDEEARRTDDALEAAWDYEWKQHLLNMALVELKGRIRPETYSAFEMYALQNRPIKEVAEFHDLSPAAIYTIRSRCVASLREIVKELEEK